MRTVDEDAGISARARTQFDEIFAQRALPTVFQPIVELASGRVVAYEALVRPPDDSVFDSPADLLAMAYRTDRVAELDWLARASACRAVMRAQPPRDLLMFLNVEPVALSADCPPDLWPDIEQTFHDYRIVLEVTERSLDRDPQSLMDGIDRQRSMVSGFAVDDVGSSALTLSLLPLISPHVIKLDLMVVQSGLTPEVTGILDVAYEEAERTHALILAEGVESAAQAELARSIGSHLGQGHLFGPPGALRAHHPRAHGSVHLPPHHAPSVQTPFEALQGQPTHRASRDILEALTRQVQTGPGDLRGPSILMCHLPEADLLTPAHLDRLSAIAQRGVYTAVLGPGIPADPGHGIRGVVHSQTDLYGQWAIIALGPSVAAALLARVTDDDENEYHFALTHNREAVIAAALSLFRRIST